MRGEHPGDLGGGVGAADEEGPPVGHLGRRAGEAGRREQRGRRRGVGTRTRTSRVDRPASTSSHRPAGHPPAPGEDRDVSRRPARSRPAGGGTAAPSSGRRRPAAASARARRGCRPGPARCSARPGRAAAGFSSAARDGQPLLHAQRVALEPVVAPVAQADQLQALVHPGAGTTPATSASSCRFDPAGETGEELRGLHEGADPRRSPGSAPGAGAVEQPHLAGVGATSPSRARIVVVLPEPFGPRKPWTWPALDHQVEPVHRPLRWTPATAVRLGRRLQLHGRHGGSSPGRVRALCHTGEPRRPGSAATRHRPPGALCQGCATSTEAWNTPPLSSWTPTSLMPRWRTPVAAAVPWKLLPTRNGGPHVADPDR